MHSTGSVFSHGLLAQIKITKSMYSYMTGKW